MIYKNKRHYTIVVFNLQPPFITADFFNFGVTMINISDDRRLMADALRHGRKMNRISRDMAVRALGVTVGELGEYEGGRTPIPRGILYSLMLHGMRVRCKRAENT